MQSHIAAFWQAISFPLKSPPQRDMRLLLEGSIAAENFFIFKIFARRCGACRQMLASALPLSLRDISSPSQLRALRALVCPLLKKPCAVAAGAAGTCLPLYKSAVEVEEVRL